MISYVHRVRLLFIFFIILIIAAGGTIFLYEMQQNSGRLWLIGAAILGAVLGLIMVVSLKIERYDDAIKAAYVLGMIKYYLYCYRIAEVRYINYSEFVFILGFSGNTKAIFLPTMIENYQEILKAIVAKSTNLTLSLSARKKMIRDKILSA